MQTLSSTRDMQAAERHGIHEDYFVPVFTHAKALQTKVRSTQLFEGFDEDTIPVRFNKSPYSNVFDPVRTNHLTMHCAYASTAYCCFYTEDFSYTLLDMSGTGM